MIGGNKTKEPNTGLGNQPKMIKSHEGEHQGDYGSTPVKVNASVIKFALCAALNSCNLGYDIGVSTTVGKLLQTEFELSDFRRELLVGSLNLWAIFGALLSNFISDRYGRRMTFQIAACGFLLGEILMGSAQSWEFLMLGRFFVGIGVGVGMAIDPVYIAEISPAKFRGYLVTWSEIAINVGILLGFSTGFFFAGVDHVIRWRVMLLTGTIFPVSMLLLVRYVMPESPRWLVSQNREAEARPILKTIYPQGFNEDLVINDIKKALEREHLAQSTFGWSLIFNPTPAFQRMLCVGVGMAIAQQAVGVDGIQYYILDVLERSGIDSEREQGLFLILLGALKLGVIVVVCQHIDNKGRRPFILTSFFGIGITLLIMSVTFKVNEFPSPAGTISLLGLYLMLFSGGVGPGAWLISSEIFTLSIRAKAMSLATAANRITAALMSSSFLSLTNYLGMPLFFFLLSVIAFSFGTYFYFYLPETKGRSLEDMSFYFAEITGDKSILEAEKKTRGEQEMTHVSVSVTTTGDDEKGSGEVI